MSDTLTIFEMLTLAGGLIGVYFKLNSEVQKLQGRVALLEKSDSMTQEKLEALLRGVNEIKLLLARKQLD
tara:strand:- start:63 stop:272 length:210 start_codon:yes stop_codon:yes gene_type:complete